MEKVIVAVVTAVLSTIFSFNAHEKQELRDIDFEKDSFSLQERLHTQKDSLSNVLRKRQAPVH